MIQLLCGDANVYIYIYNSGKIRVSIEWEKLKGDILLLNIAEVIQKVQFYSTSFSHSFGYWRYYNYVQLSLHSLLWVLIRRPPKQVT